MISQGGAAALRRFDGSGLHAAIGPVEAIPAYKLGRVLRLRVADVEAFLDSMRVQPGDLKHLYQARGQSDNDRD